MEGICFILDKNGVLDSDSVPHFRAFQNNGLNFFVKAGQGMFHFADNAIQPALITNGAFFLAFYGEIYNLEDLKNRLVEKGYRFNSGTDSETLLYGLFEYGETIIEDLNGMFSFVYLDKAESRVIAARDSAGMKRLFYFENNDFLILSSQIGEILRTGLVKKELEELQIQHYLQFGYAKKPGTFYKDIFELEEGKMLSKQGAEKIRIKDYAAANSFSSREEDKDRLVDQAEQLIYEAFIRQTAYSDLPGLFLSGGIDSTLLLLLAHREHLAMPTFSIVHEESAGSFGTSDAYYSRLAVKKFGRTIDHHEIVASISLLDELDEMISQMDQPVGDSAALLTWHLAGKAGNAAKSALSGAGGDEIFAGYNRHRAFYLYLRFRTFLWFGRLLKGLARQLPTGFDSPFRQKFRLVRIFLENMDKNPGQTYLNFASMNLIENPEGRINEIADLNFNLQNAFHHDLHHYLISDVLAINDFVESTMGIGFKMPYLDKSLVNFMLQRKPETRVRHGKKWILKAILARGGGKEFCLRPKEGFGLPFGQWIREKKIGMDRIFQEKHPILNKFVEPEKIKKIYSSHLSFKSDHSRELWAYLILAKWLNANGFE